MDIAKLPKWAQEKITALEMEARRLREERRQLLRQIDEYENRQGEHVIELEAYRGLMHGSRSQLFPIETGVVVWFDKERRRGIEVQAPREDGGWVCVSSMYGTLEIQPRAANSIYARIAED